MEQLPFSYAKVYGTDDFEVLYTELNRRFNKEPRRYALCRSETDAICIERALNNAYKTGVI